MCCAACRLLSPLPASFAYPLVPSFSLPLQLRHQERQAGAEPHPLLGLSAAKRRRSTSHPAGSSPSAPSPAAGTAQQAQQEADPRLCLWEPPVSPYGLLGARQGGGREVGVECGVMLAWRVLLGGACWVGACPACHSGSPWGCPAVTPSRHLCIACPLACCDATLPPWLPHAEEELYDDPWKLLVACMLLNKTSGAQARGEKGRGGAAGGRIARLPCGHLNYSQPAQPQGALPDALPSLLCFSGAIHPAPPPPPPPRCAR